MEKILKTINGVLLEVKEIPKKLAKNVIVQNHYSKKWNSSFGILNYGVFYDNTLLGVASFGNLMNPNSHSSIIENSEKFSIIELNRMWIDDFLGKNTESFMIASSLKLIKNNHPNIIAVQTFADGRLGCGTIYKASNFKYYGYKESIFWEHKNGETVHNVPLTNKSRPNGYLRHNISLLRGDLTPFKVKTYRYMYLLNKKYKKKILLKEKNYPKYEKGKLLFSPKINKTRLITSMLKVYDEVISSNKRLVGLDLVEVKKELEDLNKKLR